MKTRILFVDDNPLVLDGLRRQLRSMRDEWEMDFIGSGPEALALLATTPHDVVVSDMRMPGMNGAELMEEVMRLYPQTIRFILSGYADQELVMQCVGTAHQYLSKPCDIEVLKSALSNAAKLDGEMHDSSLRQLINQIDRLPSLPRIYVELTELLKNSNLSSVIIGEVIERDISMTAEILKLVNSAFFGVSHSISTPREAVTYLGKETVKTLVLSLHVFSEFNSSVTAGFSMESLWAHSLQVAIIAKKIAESIQGDKKMIEESFTAGMLHDLGRLILLSKLPAKYSHVIESAKQNGIGLLEAEQLEFQVTHARVGGYLLGLWGLPGQIVEAVTWHHCPDKNLLHRFSPTTAVHLADALIHELDLDSSELKKVSLDLPYLDSLGLLNRLDDWRGLIKDSVATGELS